MLVYYCHVHARPRYYFGPPPGAAFRFLCRNATYCCSFMYWSPLVTIDNYGCVQICVQEICVAMVKSVIDLCVRILATLSMFSFSWGSYPARAFRACSWLCLDHHTLVRVLRSLYCSLPCFPLSIIFEGYHWSQEFPSYISMMLCRVMFCPVVCIIELTWPPVESELLLAFSVS